VLKNIELSTNSADGLSEGVEGSGQTDTPITKLGQYFLKEYILGPFS